MRIEQYQPIFYVYVHKKNGEVKYVGKGCRNRAYTFTWRTNLWKAIFGDQDPEVEILVTGLTEKEALEQAETYIQYFQNQGAVLCNAATKIVSTRKGRVWLESQKEALRKKLIQRDLRPPEGRSFPKNCYKCGAKGKGKLWWDGRVEPCYSCKRKALKLFKQDSK